MPSSSSDPRVSSSSSSSTPKPSSSSSSSSSKPSSSSSSSTKPSSSSSSSKPSSSSSSSSRPSSSSGSSSSSSSKPSSTPAQVTPYISANAWMSFFLFTCLVIIILQGPLGLSASSTVSLGGWGLGALPGCAGYLAASAPWCGPVQPVVSAPIVAAAPMVPVVQQAPVMVRQQPLQYAQYQAPPGMGGHGYVATPDGGAGYAWYANQPGPTYPQYGVRPQRAQRNVQVQRPGLQIQVQEGMPWLCWQFPMACQPIIPVAYAQKAPGPQPLSPAQQIQVNQQGQPVRVLSDSPTSLQPVDAPATPGLANLESAFYPLLVGAIALLVIFDYAS